MGKAKQKVKVQCAQCGKIEYVYPSRAAKYKCCSVECLAEFAKSKDLNCKCPICGKEFHVKPFRLKRSKNICCSLKCSSKLKETTYLGSNNHQFGLTGSKNSSYKGKEVTSNYGYIRRLSWTSKAS